MQDMPRPRSKHLHKEKNRHGNDVWYVRINKGKRIRIKEVYGTEEFEEAYKAAVNGQTRPDSKKASKGSLEWLWMLYRQTGAWTKLSLATRRQRENIMRQVLKTSGNKPLSLVTTKAIQSGIDRRTPTQGRHFVDTMRGMFKWAVTAEHVRSDPTAGKAVPKLESEGFPVWTEEDLERFERRWPKGTRERVMFDVYLYTGLRRGDAARLGKQHIKNGVITIDTEKTGTRVTIPVLPELADTIAAGPIGELAIISSKTGQPLKKESLGNMFRDACRAAGIKKSAHGIRKAAATRAANNGATVAMLEAIFGWEGGHMAALYTRAADRKALAAENIEKLSKKRTSIPAPKGKVRENGEKG